MATDNLALSLDVFGLSNLKRSYVSAMKLIDAAVGKVRSGSAIYNPPSLADGAGTTTTVSVPGVVLGDYVSGVSFSLDIAGITVSAWVSGADTVSVRFQNESGGTLDLSSGTLRVRVRAQ